jgi:hypothetical protein
MKASKTYREIIRIDHAIAEYLKRNEEDTQLGIVLKRFVKKQLQPIKEDYDELVYINSVRHAFKDEKGVLIKDSNGQLCYTEEGEIGRIKANKDLLSQTVEIDVRFLVEKPHGLTEEQEEAFEGIFWKSEK